MKGFLAVARREIAQRKMLFVAAAFAAVISFLIPLVRGFHGMDAFEARSAFALGLSVVFLLFVSAYLGGTRLPGAIAGRRIGFDFARPLSAAAVWGGTLAATLFLALGSAFVAFAPALLGGDSTTWKNLVDEGELRVPWPIVVVGASLLVFGLFGAAGVALRARSPRLAIDLLLGAATLAAAAYGLIRLQWAGVTRAVMTGAFFVLAILATVALLGAGFAAVARGRTEIRAANRAQSVVLWTAIAIGLLGLYAYASWLFSAPPSRLTGINITGASAAGPWVYVEGVARGAEAHFLYDTSGGRYARVPWGTGEPAFSEDGLVAAWIQRLGKDDRLHVVDLNAPRPEPRIRVAVADDADDLVLDAHGSRAAVYTKDGVSIYDLRNGRLLFSARLGEYSASPRAFFLGPDRLRLYWVPKADDKVEVDIYEVDLPAKKLARTGSITGLTGWPMLATDRAGRRLVCNEFDSKRLRLFDARTGEFLATLTEGESFAGPARFLADDRLVALIHRSGERLLGLFSADGTPVAAISLPGEPLPRTQRSTALGAEIAPGELVLSTGAPGAMPGYLADLKTASLRPLGLRGRPVFRWVAFFGRPNAVPEPGSPSTLLFQADSGELLRLDPSTGRPQVILGKPAH
jgi:hypothetical protein